MGGFENNFRNSIQEIIELFTHKVYLISRDTTVMCPCINYETKQAFEDCNKCLGTGHRIKIKNIEVASQYAEMPSANRPNENATMGKSYFTHPKYKVNYLDMIIDKNEVYIINKVKDMAAFKNEIVYRQCIGYQKRNASELFLNTFNSIINKK